MRIIDADWLKAAIHKFRSEIDREMTEEDVSAYIDATPPVDAVPYTIKDVKLIIDVSGIADKVHGKAIEIKFGKEEGDV